MSREQSNQEHKGPHFSFALNSDQVILLATLREPSPSGKIWWNSLNFKKLVAGEVELLEAQGWIGSRGLRVARGLFGVLALTEDYRPRVFGKTKSSYGSLIIPQSNEAAVEEAFDTRVFKKEIKEADLLTLSFVYHRTRYLRERFGPNFSPRFYESEVSAALRTTPGRAKSSLVRLEGLLCRAGLDRSKEIEVGVINIAEGIQLLPENPNKTKVQYRARWFLPTARVQDAALTLSRYDEEFAQSLQQPAPVPPDHFAFRRLGAVLADLGDEIVQRQSEERERAYQARWKLRAGSGIF